MLLVLLCFLGGWGVSLALIIIIYSEEKGSVQIFTHVNDMDNYRGL